MSKVDEMQYSESSEHLNMFVNRKFLKKVMIESAREAPGEFSSPGSARGKKYIVGAPFGQFCNFKKENW